MELHTMKTEIVGSYYNKSIKEVKALFKSVTRVHLFLSVQKIIKCI